MSAGPIDPLDCEFEFEFAQPASNAAAAHTATNIVLVMSLGSSWCILVRIGALHSGVVPIPSVVTRRDESRLTVHGSSPTCSATSTPRTASPVGARSTRGHDARFCATGSAAGEGRDR